MIGRKIENFTKNGQKIYAFDFFGTKEEFDAFIETSPQYYDWEKVNEGSVFFTEDENKAYLLDTDLEWHEVEGGTGETTDYAHLISKPKINGISLDGDKGNHDLGIVKLIEVEENTTVNGYSVPDLTKADMENAFNALQGGFPCFITDATGKFTYKVKQVDTNDEDIFVCFDFCDIMVLNYKLDVNDDVTIEHKNIGCNISTAIPDTGAVDTKVGSEKAIADVRENLVTYIDQSDTNIYTDLDENKLDKKTNTTVYEQTYIKKTDGTQDVRSGTSDNVVGTYVLRDANGRARMADPSEAQDVATKNYVDTQAQQIMNYVKKALKGA